MDQRSIEKHFRRWHRREKPTAEPVDSKPDQQGRMHKSTTVGGLSVADRLRKEWDPRRGGLPLFLGNPL